MALLASQRNENGVVVVFQSRKMEAKASRAFTR